MRRQHGLAHPTQFWPLSVEKSTHPLPSPALYGTGLRTFLRQPGVFQYRQQRNQFSCLCPKETNPASTWEDDAAAWHALQLAVAAERTQLECAALREAATTSLFTRQPSPNWHHTLTCLPGWESPTDVSQSPAPQLAQRTGPIWGEKKRFSPHMKSGGSKPWGCRQGGSANHTCRNRKEARQAQLCSMCWSIEHVAEECTVAKVEPELPPLMKKAQELPPLTLLEKVALMRSAEWTPEVCNLSRTRSFIRFSELESLSLDMIRWLVT
jgi:hypothetical protein